MLNNGLREQLLDMGLPEAMHELPTLRLIVEYRTGKPPRSSATVDEVARRLIQHENSVRYAAACSHRDQRPDRSNPSRMQLGCESLPSVVGCIR